MFGERPRPRQPGRLDSAKRWVERQTGYFLEAMALTLIFKAHWGAPGSEAFYGTAAQVIATMYVAVALEFFVGEGVVLDAAGRVEFVLLLGVSWLGLLASFEALSREPHSWSPSMAAAGLLASVFMVTTGLGHRVNIRNANLVRPVVYVATFSPVLILFLR